MSDSNNAEGHTQNNEEKDNSSSSNSIEIRCLIDNSSVGGLIGKAGSNVKKVREESGAFISIMKSDFRNIQERIMVVKGNVNQISKAAFLIAELYEKYQHNSSTYEEPSKSLIEGSKDKRDDSAVLRILAHKSAVGAIIGKAGAVIKETQTETGARVQVSNEPLPNSTEKTVTITGTPSAVESATLRISTQLRDNPIKPGTRVYEYNPSPPGGYVNDRRGGYDRDNHYNERDNNRGEGRRDNRNFNSSSAPSSNPSSTSSLTPPSTQKIAIPTVCAGCVIGKHGSVIRDLRTQSGTQISIADPDPASPNERVVTLTGTASGIQTAVYLIRQLVEQYTPQQNTQQQY